MVMIQRKLVVHQVHRLDWHLVDGQKIDLVVDCHSSGWHDYLMERNFHYPVMVVVVVVVEEVDCSFEWVRLSSL